MDKQHIQNLIIVGLLAKMIFFEARGEGREGMIAAACVARNRVQLQSKEFGTTWEEVLTKDAAFEGLGQFSLTRPYNKIMREPYAYAECLEIAAGVFFNEIEDITMGSVFFYKPAYKETGEVNWKKAPYFCPKRTFKMRIREHMFHGPYTDT